MTEYRFTLPDLGEGIAEAEILRWHVRAGQQVGEGDPLLDVETEKAIVEIPSPATGRVGRLEVDEGARVPVGTVLIVIETEGEAAPRGASSGEAGGKPRSKASPRVRKLARELGVDVDSVASIVEGRPLTEADVRAAAGALPGGSSAEHVADEHVPVRGVRGRLVRHLTQVQREVPAVTVVEECDFTALDLAHAGFERTAFLLKAVSAALADVPELNATFADGGIAVHQRHDIGLAVQAAEGLVVPVLRDVESRSLGALADEARRVTDGARENRLAPTELRGSTFTVTEAGHLGGLFATPLVNAPEVGVLGLHRVDERPVVRGGEVVIRRIGNVSCTFDHRAVDGFHASAFLLRFVELVQQPEALLPGDGAPGEAGERRGPGTDSALGKRLAATAEPERPGIVLELVREHAAALVEGERPIDPDIAFKDLGFDSRMAVELRNRLARATGLRLPSTLLFDHPTPAGVADRVLSEALGAPRPRPRAAPAPSALPPDEPIAILGLACRYPGGVASPEQLWELVASGADAISGFPSDRGWDLEGLYHPDPDHPGTSYVREGGFLGEAGEFDAQFFGISPREALAMDPQQRLLLEAAWEALEDAGIDPTSLRGSQAGVFAGVIAAEYGGGEGGPPGLEGFGLTGTTTSVASGRLAYTLGLEGPALSVDTACSSSLVALHLACRSLRAGECSLALAGGATVMASPRLFLEFARQRGLAPDGRCKSFAAAADGTAWAEGAGLVVLERLSEARRLGHPVLAVVRGSAVNQDGASNGLTAPNGPSQERVIAQALADARVSPAAVDAVEGHGTGTRLGDPIEAQALLSAYGREPRDRPLWLGSIKSNIGHSSAAAGVAGVIKMVMAMRHETLPRTLHVDAPTPQVDWSAGAVELLSEAREWPRGERARLAGVSSFGISGTNAHLILEEGPRPGGRPDATAAPLLESVPLPISAKSEQALRAQAERLSAHLHEHPELDLLDVGFSLATRARFDHRAVAVGAGREELLAALAALAAGAPSPNAHTGTASGGRLAYLFTGQGAQRPGMGRELFETYPVYAESFEAAAGPIGQELGEPLTEILFAGGEEAAERLNHTTYAQAALFATEVALFRLLSSFGLAPDLLAGHSIGELAAAHVSGVLSLADAAKLVSARARLMGELPQGGAMLAIEAGEEEVAESLRGRENELSIAALNGPGAVVISGVEEAVQALDAHWQGERRRTKRLAVSHAFHSPLMEPMLAPFREVADSLSYRQPQIPIVSGPSGQPLTADQATDPAYWVAQVRRPVRFSDAIASLAGLGATTYLELGPDGVLCAMAQGTLEAAGLQPALVPTLREGRAEPEAIAEALARSHVSGAALDWDAFFEAAKRRRVPLPTYPFQRRRYWLEDASATGDAASIGQASADHPLLGAAVALADGAGEGLLLTGRLSLSTHPWLADHALAGAVLLPGAAFLELALSAAERVGAEQVEELTLQAPLLLPEAGALALQVSVAEPDAEGRRRLSIHSRPEQGQDSPEWALHAQGTLRRGRAAAPEPIAGWPPPGAVEIELADFYDRLADAGYEYGPAFQGLTAAWREDETIYAEISLPERQEAHARRFAVHPALLDACFHAALLDTDPAEGTRLPFGFSGVSLGEARGASGLRVRIAPAGDHIALAATDSSGTPVLSIASLASRPLGPALLKAQAARPDSLLVTDWIEVEPTGEEPGEVEVFTAEPGEDGEGPAGEARARCAGLLERLRAFLADESLAASKLVLVTRFAVATAEGEAPDPAQAALWGLVRSAQSEHPGRFALLDSDATAASLAALSAALATAEPQLALREGRALAPRLARAGEEEGRLLPPAGPWRLQARAGGTLESLALVPHPEAGRPLAPGEVRIEIRAAGLNFRDVLVALGHYPGAAPLGGEGAGVVVEVGSEVSDLAPGERVMGLIAGAFGPLAVAERRTLAPIPAGWSFAAAASLPSAFLTAHYGLRDLAALAPGERVLIHAAAGGVGMAAVQLAHHLGAEVFATAHPDKWEALGALGVEEGHIASSRDLDFAQRFLDLSGGDGLDVVLNSLAHEFVDASLGLLGRGGRFVEMGKTDVRDPERVAGAHPGVAYRAFDLFEAGPERLGEMLAEILELFERGALAHPPIATWDVRRAPQAFRHLREGRNVGKVVLSLPRPLDPEATVLITGATGGLGALLARHLVAAHGAGHLLLASRRGPAAPGATELRAQLEGLGARVSLRACDLAEREQVAGLLDSIAPEHPLGAVIHAAGVLEDATIDTLTPAQLDRVLAAKADAAWHLHELTAEMELSSFLLFSSAAAALGSPGQGNYAAANAFLDALAGRRRAQGLPATSIAWGPWERQGGMISRLGEADRARIRRSGVGSLSDAQGLALFDAALGAEQPALLALRLDQPELRARARAGTLAPILRGLVSTRARRERPVSLAAQLAGLEPSERERAVLDLVRAEAAVVLGHGSADAVEPGGTFKDLGFDSLAAVELRNRLNAATGLWFSTASVFDHPTAEKLARYLSGLVAPKEEGDEGGGDAVDAELNRLESMLGRIESGDRRARVAGRLRTLIAALQVGERDDLADATDEEIFELLDEELEQR